MRELLENHLVPVDQGRLGRQAEQGDAAAGDHRVEQLIEGGRRAAHLQADVEALRHLERGHHRAQILASTRRPA